MDPNWRHFYGPDLVLKSEPLAPPELSHNATGDLKISFTLSCPPEDFLGVEMKRVVDIPIFFIAPVRERWSLTEMACLVSEYSPVLRLNQGVSDVGDGQVRLQVLVLLTSLTVALQHVCSKGRHTGLSGTVLAGAY